MEMNFCRRCGRPLKNTHDHVYQCTSGHVLYANASPAVAVFFVSADEHQILLTTRGQEPNLGMLDAPGGFVDGSETFEEAAARELTEELGLSPQDYEPLSYLGSACDGYPYAGEAIPFVTNLYWSRLTTDTPLQPADDVASVSWYDLSAVDFGKIHSEDICIGIRSLQQMFLDAKAEKQ